MAFDRLYVVFALGYAVFGMGVGLFMAGSHDHSLQPAHAHILLPGFVVSFLYGITHRLWLVQPPPPPLSRLAAAQFYIHHLGAIGLGIGLILLYGGLVPDAQIEPLLAVSSLGVLAGALLMFWLVLKHGSSKV